MSDNERNTAEAMSKKWENWHLAIICKIHDLKEFFALWNENKL